MIVSADQSKILLVNSKIRSFSIFRLNIQRTSKFALYIINTQMIRNQLQIHPKPQQQFHKNSFNGTEQLKSTIVSTVKFSSQSKSNFYSDKSNIDLRSLIKDTPLLIAHKKQGLPSLYQQPLQFPNEQVLILIGNTQYSIDYSSINSFKISFAKIIKKQTWISKISQQALKVKILSVISKLNCIFAAQLKINLEEYGKQKLRQMYQQKNNNRETHKQDSILKMQENPDKEQKIYLCQNQASENLYSKINVKKQIRKRRLYEEP